MSTVRSAGCGPWYILRLMFTHINSHIKNRRLRHSEIRNNVRTEACGAEWPVRGREEHPTEEADEGSRGSVRVQCVTHNKESSTRGRRWQRAEQAPYASGGYVTAQPTDKDYHFTTREAMQEGINNGEFIENAEFSGNMYGTSKAAVENVRAKNLICILDVDIQGVKRIKESDLDPIYISIQPPSMEILEKRLRDRQTETEESLQKRLEAARIDMELSKEPGVFDIVIINDDLEKAYEELKKILNEEITKVQEAK
ncbi:hypothetical protein CHARACLAT_013870 [Characodon lateralis]|uniref:Guanylate kinase-like domain-containing protein n=1 Tax=Characodon lateralis TaxID=208331 RepID=A0ABU7F536_9TELE|nr:hypothetical protein [Characodon lateralis]